MNNTDLENNNQARTPAEQDKKHARQSYLYFQHRQMSARL